MTEHGRGLRQERIEHIIVLMMENRSFDHLLGFLPHPDPDYPGLGGGEHSCRSTRVTRPGAALRRRPLPPPPARRRRPGSLPPRGDASDRAGRPGWLTMSQTLFADYLWKLDSSLLGVASHSPSEPDWI